MSFFDLIVASEERVSRRETQRQNSARLAFSTHTIDSTGSGHTRYPEAIPFDVTFLTPPMVFTGGALITPTPTGWHDAELSSGVWQWERNTKGHYTGAYIYMNVRMAAIDDEGFDPPKVTTQHHLMFMGVAYKDLGSEVATEAQLLEPKTVGMKGE